MSMGPVEFLVAVGALRGLLLLALVVAVCQAIRLHLRDDQRSPMPWAFMVVALVATLAIVSLST